MKRATALFALTIVCAASAGSAAWAGPFGGEWIGAFKGQTDWVFVQVRIGGEGKDMTGRMDLPMNGEHAILLQAVKGDDTHLSFELPGYSGSLVFQGQLGENGRVTGSVRQAWSGSTFELVRLHPSPREGLTAFAGNYESGRPRDVMLVYTQDNTLCYVEYATGRMGRLYPVGPDRFVSGGSVLSGFPVVLEVSFERDGTGVVVAARWQRDNEAPRLVRRRTFYRAEPARFTSGTDVTLAGDLLVPEGRGPHPAVVLIPGSGRVNRETLMPFADSIARHGVAVLINDKRGVGASTGNYARAGINELAADALAGVEWLKTHPAINRAQIGLLGTSLGGWVAPLAATRSADVKFIIVESAPAMTPAEHERSRVQNQMRADGQPREAIVQALAFMDRKFKVGRTGKGWDDLQNAATRGEREGWLRYVNNPVSLESLQWNWDNVLSYDPLPVLSRLGVPVLVLYGELDRIVDAEANQKRMEKALRAAGNRDVTVRVFPSANHNFLAAATGGPSEVPRLKGFVEGYFDSRVTWLLDHVDESAPSTTSAGDATLDASDELLAAMVGGSSDPIR